MGFALPTGSGSLFEAYPVNRRTVLVVLFTAAAFVLWCVADFGAYHREYDRLFRKGLTSSGDPGSSEALTVFHQAQAYGLLQELSIRSPDILFFNDSVMGGHHADEARTGIDEMMAASLGVTVRGVSGAGYTAVVYSRLAELAASAAHKSRLALFSINPRSFCSEWFFTADYWHSEMAGFLPLMSHRPGVGAWLRWLPSRLAGFDLRAHAAGEDRREAVPDISAYFRAKRRDLDMFNPVRPELNESEVAIRRHFLENYMAVEVAAGHPMLAGISRTIEVFRASGVTVLAYVTPVDAQEAIRLTGPVFMDEFRRDVSEIRRTVEGAGATFLDLSEYLDSGCFVDRDYACEHLNMRGRSAVAKALSAKARELLQSSR
jgi:hypothetical protein